MSSTVPQISVIMPVHNAASFLKEAIESICNQTFSDFELIIIDDGSTDSSPQIMREFKDKRIKIIRHEKNKGIVNTLNEGLSIARGEYVARMDADDIALSQRFEWQIAYLKNNHTVDIVGSSIKVFGIDNYVWNLPTDPGEVDAHSLFRCSMAHPSVMMRKKSLKKYQLKYSVEYKDAEDFFLWAYALSLGGKLANISEPYLLYRTHRKQIGHNNETQISSTLRIYGWQLKHRLGITANPHDLKLHHYIATLSKSRDIRSLLAKKYWLMRLIDANNRTEAYDKKIFRELCAWYWMDNCYVSTVGFRKYLYMLMYPATTKKIFEKITSRFI